MAVHGRSVQVAVPGRHGSVDSRQIPREAQTSGTLGGGDRDAGVPSEPGESSAS